MHGTNTNKKYEPKNEKRNTNNKKKTNFTTLSLTQHQLLPPSLSQIHQASQSA